MGWHIKLQAKSGCLLVKDSALSLEIGFCGPGWGVMAMGSAVPLVPGDWNELMPIAA